MVIDHTSFAVSDTEGDHTLIAGDNFIQSDVILGKEKIKVRHYISSRIIMILELNLLFNHGINSINKILVHKRGTPFPFWVENIYY